MTTTSYACPVCGTVHEYQWERYKNHVCRVCEQRARCVAHDRIVHGYNAAPLGPGLMVFHDGRQDDACDQVTGDGSVLVDGTEFRMREGYMGGVVVLPLSTVVPVAQTVVWSRDGHIEWTSAGVPTPFAGYIGEKSGRRRLIGRAPSTFEWMVRKTSHNHAVRKGVEPTLEEARSRVIEELDEINHLRADPT